MSGDRKVRVLRPLDFIRILNNSSGIMSQKCSVVLGHLIDEKPLPSEGTGFMLVYPVSGDMQHAVAVYRCRGGGVVYHDSTCRRVPENVRDYFRRHGISRLHKASRMQQGWKYRSCVYHAITFLWYAVTHCSFGPRKLISKYDEYVGTNPEEKVFNCVKRLASKARPPVNLYTTAYKATIPVVSTDSEEESESSEKSKTSRKRKSDSLDGSPTKRARTE